MGASPARRRARPAACRRAGDPCRPGRLDRSRSRRGAAGRRLRLRLVCGCPAVAWLGMRAAEIGRATSELQSLMRISYAVFCLKKKKQNIIIEEHEIRTK